MIGKLLDEVGNILFFTIALTLLISTANAATKLERNIREDVTKNRVSDIYTENDMYSDAYEVKTMKDFTEDGSTKLVTTVKMSKAEVAAEIYNGINSGVTYYIGITWVNPADISSMKDVYDLCKKSTYLRYTETRAKDANGDEDTYNLLCYYK